MLSRGKIRLSSAASAPLHLRSFALLALLSLPPHALHPPVSALLPDPSVHARKTLLPRCPGKPCSREFRARVTLPPCIHSTPGVPILRRNRFRRRKARFPPQAKCC